MVATQHSRSGSRPQDGGRSAEIAAVERLLGQAADFELRAPELALVLGERAAALAEAAGAEELWVRGEGLAVSARVRLGLRAPTVGRAVAALRAAEDTGQTTLAAQLRTDLAVCARSVGAPLTGLAALRPVLDASSFGGARKAAVLSQLVACLAQFGRKLELDKTLAEADRLCGADDDLDGDGRLLARSLLRVAVSAHRRRHGDVIGAADAARTGLGFLEQLEDAQHDGGVVRVRLVLQLVCSLLDRGDGRNALDLAQSVLDEPARAASVAPAGWLRMAIATRVLLPSGSVEAAARMLRDAVHATERHELHALTGRLWTELAHVEERLGRYAEAIECLQLARAAEHIHARARRQAVGLLAGEFGGGGHEVDLDRVLGSVPAGEGTSASVAVAPLSVPEPKVPASREPSAEVATGNGDAPRPRVAAEQSRNNSERPSWSLAPEPADKRPDVAKVSRAEDAAQVSRWDEIGAASRLERTSRADEVGRSEREPARAKADESAAASLGQRESVRDRADEVAAVSRLDSRESVRSDAGMSRSEPASGDVVRYRRPETAASGMPLESERRTAGGRRRAEEKSVGQSADVSPNEVSSEIVAISRSERADTRASRKTRHDSEHGSVAARSVLDRLGVSTGAGGGRRRAPGTGEPESGGHRRAPGTGEPESGGRRRAEDGPSRESVAPEAVGEGVRGESVDAGRDSAGRADESTTLSGDSGTRREDTAREDVGSSSESWLSADAEPVSRADVSPAGRAESEARSENEPAPSMPVIDNWLPRLRLPPSLAPWDDSTDTDSEPAPSNSTSETPFTNAPVLQDDGLGEPFRTELTGVPDDDLPEDAGLADLLARALAEHQAGTASAAALVKRLGNQSSSEPRPVNGHGRNGSEPGNGRHRGDR
ncbi:hypothetical protein [Amycolatopsis tucumanensis]|uniref:Uncharacterized protein n=1 Tax=Amycolatopsis tucumanensis TaxID=401106 RepID=A0ABP7J7C2_9PSEU|nr:hypothetical protein [Amycolatopsis tucumanensis]MCF6423134.1 hypothetical protein [Amycolatopsis tucumanensis]